MGVFRFFHSNAIYQNINKSALATLRKKTGFSIANIRKALDLNNNDPAKAEEWLKEQAKALGWNKALKMQHRQASQGLVGIALNNKKVAMVEVNCETDFVARNEKFKTLVESMTKTCMNIPVLNSGSDTNKIYLSTETLGNLKSKENSFADEVALLIGSIGENMVLRRGFCYETNRNDVEVAVAVHPPADNHGVLLGKYCTFVSYQKNPDISTTEDVIGNLCKHIIGTNPSEIGEEGELEETKEKVEMKEGEEEEKENENNNKSKALLHQDFLLDESVTVGEYLKESGIKVLDFKRFECGEAETEEMQSEEKEEREVSSAKG